MPRWNVWNTSAETPKAVKEVDTVKIIDTEESYIAKETMLNEKVMDRMLHRASQNNTAIIAVQY